VSSDQRLSSGFCWPAREDPGEVETDEREVVFTVAVVAVELEDRMRRGMRWAPLEHLPLPPPLPLPVLPLLMLALGMRVVTTMLLLKERLGLRGW